jgi:NAD(P)H dehydrogenase (quinone)
MIIVTGTSGQLGQLVIAELVKKTAPQNIVAAVRDPSKAKNLADLGVNIRVADYSKPETLDVAFADAKKILLISSSEIGKRESQHKAVIEAAKKVKGLELFAYTSILNSDVATMKLAGEHVATEKLIKEANLPAVILRNGWYSENYLDAVKGAILHGALYGSAGDGKISSASRADYALAAAVILTSEKQVGKIYELAGDRSYTLTELAKIVSEITGKNVIYKNLAENEYQKLLVQVGLPEAYASIFADSDVGISKGDLYSEKRDLSNLIKRETTTIGSTIRENL